LKIENLAPQGFAAHQSSKKENEKQERPFLKAFGSVWSLYSETYFLQHFPKALRTGVLILIVTIS
jgi:hypothetical protein